MAKLTITIEDTPEAREALKYLIESVVPAESESWRNTSGPTAKAQAEAFEQFGEALEGALEKEPNA